MQPFVGMDTVWMPAGRCSLDSTRFHISFRCAVRHCVRAPSRAMLLDSVRCHDQLPSVWLRILEQVLLFLRIASAVKVGVVRELVRTSCGSGPFLLPWSCAISVDVGLPILQHPHRPSVLAAGDVADAMAFLNTARSPKPRLCCAPT